MIQFESLVELDYLYLLDYDPDVKQFEEQPVTIQYLWEEKSLRYTPDFLVVRHECTNLVECKPDRFVHSEENQRKFKAAEKWCAETGWKFSVVTSNEIRSGFRLQNVKFLTRFARYQPDVVVRSRIYDYFLRTDQPLTVINLAQRISEHNLAIGIAAIFHLVFHHELLVNLDQASVTETSFVYLVSKIGESR